MFAIYENQTVNPRDLYWSAILLFEDVKEWICYGSQPWGQVAKPFTVNLLFHIHQKKNAAKIRRVNGAQNTCNIVGFPFPLDVSDSEG